LKLKLFQSNKFKKHYPKRVKNQEYDIIFSSVIETLLNQKPLDLKFKDHRLTSDFNHCRECHIKNDLLLIYQVLDNELRLVDIGTHSQLFG